MKQALHHSKNSHSAVEKNSAESVNSMQNGSTLIEVIIAVAVISLALIAIVASSVMVIRNQRYSAAQHQATAYTQESLEWVRKMRDTLGWATFFADLQADNPVAPTYCLDSLPATTAAFEALSSSSSCAAVITGSVFTRSMQITLSSSAPQIVTAITTVSWDDGGKTFQVQTTLVLTNQE